MYLLNILQVIAEIANYYASLITAVVTGVLACITYLYIKEIREERRIKILDHIANYALNPLVSKLEKDISGLKKNQYFEIRPYYRTEKYAVDLIVHLSTSFLDDLNYRVHRKALPERGRKRVERYNEEYGKARNDLENKIRDLASSIPKNYIGAVSSFKEELEREKGKIVIRQGPENAAIHTLEFIIQEQVELDVAHDYKEFWKRYGDRLKAELYKNEEIKNKIDMLQRNKKEIIKMAENYKKTVEDLMEELVNTYGVPIKK